MDPRVQTTPTDLQAQFNDSQLASSVLKDLTTAVASAGNIERQLQKAKTNASAAPVIREFEKKFTAVVGPPPGGFGTPVIPVDTDVTSLRHYATEFRNLLAAMQSADVRPTPEQVHALKQDSGAAQQALTKWQALVSTDLPQLNDRLKQSGLAPIQSGSPAE
jgi:hypothetical protein